MAVFTTPGITTYYVPANMTKMTARCLGAGGGGTNGAGGGAGGAGGGGGGFSLKSNIAVQGGVQVQVIVGQGGNGDHGAASSVSLPLGAGLVCSAPGGGYPQGSNGGVGCPASSCLGDTKFSGGNGDGGSTYQGGGGGGGARAVTNGGNASAENGGNYGGGRGSTQPPPPEPTVAASAGIAAGTTAAGGGGGGGLDSEPGKPGGNGCVELDFS